MRLARAIVISMRPWQWYKNLVALVGLVFSGMLLDPIAVERAIASVILLCLLSGGIYLLNDLRDREKDRHHPKKRHRPVASGELGQVTALFTGAVLVAGSIIAGYWIVPGLGLSMLSLALLNILYTLYLSEMVIVDVLAISLGFVIRAIAGCAAIGVMVSPWLFGTTMLLALFLALVKRKSEILLLEKRARKHKKTYKEYTLPLLEQYATITTTLLLATYALYTALSEHTLLVATLPVAIYSVYRYLYLAEKNNTGGEPERALRDKGLIASIVVWGLLVLAILYPQVG